MERLFFLASYRRLDSAMTSIACFSLWEPRIESLGPSLRGGSSVYDHPPKEEEEGLGTDGR
jgi:hypothetical protein